MISQKTLRRLDHSTGYLLWLDMDPPVRLCSYGEVTAAGQQWRAGAFVVDGLEEGEHGVEGITITLDDIDYLCARRLRQQWRPAIACEWSLLEKGDDGWETELLFSGQLEAPTLNGTGSVTIRAALNGPDTSFCPRVPFESSHSLARGFEIVINGTTYRMGE